MNMKKKILPLLLITTIAFTGCTAGKQDSYSTKADVICLDPIQEDGFDDVLKAAKEAGCKVFLVDRKVSADESLYEGWLGSNFDLEGENAGKWLVDEAKGKKMNIVVLQGGAGASAQIGRQIGRAHV